MADVKIRVIAEDETKGLLDKLDLKMVALTATFIKLTKEYIKFTFESAKYSARVETLAVVTQQLGKNAGLTAREIRDLEVAIQKKGITTEKARSALARMMQAQLDVTKASQLARLAQDGAVISGTNSSEAFSKLVDVVVTGNVRMARTMGIQVNFNEALDKTAESLGKTREELTTTEVAQGRMNAVLEQGIQISGTYAAAMETVGKQLESTPRYIDEFKRAYGSIFIEDLGKGNNLLQDALKWGTEYADGIVTINKAMDAGIVPRRSLAAVEWGLVLGRYDLVKITKQVEDIELLRIDSITRANELQHQGLITKLALTKVEIGMASAIEKTTVAQEASRREAELMGLAWFENSEQELRVMQIQAIHAGDFALATSIGQQIDLLETQNEELDELIKLLDSLDGRQINASMLIKVTTKQFVTKFTQSTQEQAERTSQPPSKRQLDEFGFASGGSFTVPPGYPNDSFPMQVQSGEHVQVTPAGQNSNADVVEAIQGQAIDYNQFARVLRDTLLQTSD